MIPGRIFSTRGVILLALTATVGLSIISYRSIVKLKNLNELVDHTHVVQYNIQRTYSALSDVDSELKAYLLTKDTTYFHNLINERATVRASVEKLKILTKDNPAQNAKILSLDSLINVRWGYMESIIRGDETHYDYLSAKIERCNHQLKELITIIAFREGELLQARSDHSTQFQSSAPFLLLAIQIVIALFLLIGFVKVTSDLNLKARLQKETLQNNKELKDQKDFIQSIFENTVDVIIIFDMKFNMIAMNKRARELYNLNDSAIGKNVFDVYPNSQGSDFIKGIGDALDGKASHSTARESVVYKGTFYESFYVPLFSAEKQIGAMAIHHDISELIKVTSEIKAINLQLEKSNRELEQFAYVTSHDLQEPLRKIRTFTDRIKRNFDNKEVAIKDLDKVTSSAERMSILIRDILNYSKLTSSAEQHEEVDLNDILDQVIQDFELTIEEKDALVESSRLPRVLGSKQQLSQVFANILSNALKFCTNAPCIKIGCRHHEGKFEISFSDNGIGFEQVYAEQIFGVFQRLHHRKEFTGTGIGLALCRRIIENHGGSIKATSESGKGTTILVTIPDLIKDRTGQIQIDSAMRI